MNCREFNNNLTEYLAGRLPASRNASMHAHSIGCPQCSRLEREERDLRERFRALPRATQHPDIWPRLVSQLEAPRPPRFAFFRPPWAYAGALGAFAACAGLVWIGMGNLFVTPPSPPAPIASLAYETEVVRMVRQTRQMPSAESEALGASIQASRDAESSVLLGGSSQ